MVYAIRQNNLELLKLMVNTKNSIINDYCLDELDVIIILTKYFILFYKNYMKKFKIDYPIYFAAIESNLSKECFEILTPEIYLNDKNTTTKIATINNNNNKNQLDISQLYYKGMSILRYAIQVNLDVDILKLLITPKFCSRELITVRDPVNNFYYLKFLFLYAIMVFFLVKEFLTSREYALKNNKKYYAELIDQVHFLSIKI